MRSAPKSRNGFVLIAALWLLIALGAVGLDAALRSRTRRLAAANLLDETRARAAAMAGTEYARSRLTAAMLDRADELRSQAARSRGSRNTVQSAMNVTSLFRQADPAEDPWREPDQLVAPEMAFGDARFTLRVRDTGAALNLNSATEEMLRNFFAQGLRVDYAEADRIAQAIMDWRDEDELARIGGGEREEYLDANLPVLPTNRLFAEVAELRHVLGMTQELYEAALPYLSLVGSARINVNAAPEPVLLALPGMTPGAAAELVRLRQNGDVPRSLAELRAMLPALRSGLEAAGNEFTRRVTYATNEVEILAEGGIESGVVRVQAIVVVARSNTGAVVVWRKID